jgi:hypothetical protein
LLDSITCLHLHNGQTKVSQSHRQEDRICISLLIREIEKEKKRHHQRTNSQSIN